MKAQLTKTDCMNARNLGDKKETVKQAVLIACKAGEFSEPVTVRWYMSRSGDGASPVYCALWVRCSPYYVSGRGVAKGYGYHKASAAFQEACDSAGIELLQPVDGRGDSSVRDALYAVGAALGFERAELHICEG